MAPGVLGPRPLLLGFVVVYVLLVLYLLSSLSTVPLAPAPRCSKLALGTSAGSTPGDTLAQLVPSSAIPFKFHKVMHIEDLGEQETMLLDEMFQDDRRRHIEMREVVEKAWKHLESTRPDLEIDEVLRADRVFDRQYGTVYTLELNIHNVSMPQQQYTRTMQLYRPTLPVTIVKSDLSLPRTRINIIVTIYNRCALFKSFLETLVTRHGDQNLRLVVADFASTECNVRSLLEESLPTSKFLYLSLPPPFVKVTALQKAIDLVSNSLDELLFMCDVDIVIPTGFFDILRRETIQGVQAMVPVCFSLYQDQPEVAISTNGFWRTYGYAVIGIYKSDLMSVGGYREATSWRGEDRDLITRLVNAGYKIFRSQEAEPWRKCHELLDAQDRLDCESVQFDKVGDKQRVGKMYIQAIEDLKRMSKREKELTCPPIKIFVYPLPERFTLTPLRLNAAQKPALPDDCANNHYSGEVTIHRSILLSKFSTFDAASADFFYVPVYNSCHKSVARLQSQRVDDSLLEAAYRHVQTEYAHLNRSAGMNHIWTFAEHVSSNIEAHLKFTKKYDTAAAVDATRTQQLTNQRSNTGTWHGSSIIVTTNGDRSGAYSPWKDIVIPPNLESQIKPVWPEPRFLLADEREYTASFGGSVVDCSTCPPHWPRCCESTNVVRSFIREHLTQYDDFAIVESRHAPSYASNMRRSNFCLCPPGRSGVFVRPYEAILSGCIPVVFSPHVDLAFAGVIEYDKFVIYYDIEKLPQLATYLRSVSQEEIVKRRLAMEKIWRRLMFNTIMEEGDAVSTMMELLTARKCRATAGVTSGHSLVSP